MKVRWQKLLLTATFWLATEIWFNFLGIDDLVDYSEFIFERPEIVLLLVTPISSLFFKTFGDQSFTVWSQSYLLLEKSTAEGKTDESIMAKITKENS